MDPDLQWAESTKYDSNAVVVKKCPSGRYAIFSREFHFLCFAHATQCLEELPEPPPQRPRPTPRVIEPMGLEIEL